MAKRPKLTRMEKLDRDITLATRKQERALKLGEKSKRMLLASARELARAQAAKRRLEQKMADELVRQAAPMGMVNDGEPVEPVTPLPKPDPVEDFVSRGQAAQAAVDQAVSVFERHKGEAATMVKLKAPRKRKPKADRPKPGEPGPALLAEMLPPLGREARMKSMGFRKTKSRAKMSSS